MLHEILKNRELRAKRQKEFLALYQKPLISVTVNIPGNKKLSDEAIFIYKIMIKSLKTALHVNLHELFYMEEKTGVEGIFYANMNAKNIKLLTIKLEENEILGRFIDFDVINLNGKILSRKDFGIKSRTCYLCSEKAVICAKSKKHRINELLGYIKFCVTSYKSMVNIANLAQKALKIEVDLTPKPGLVDMKDSGSHKDMDRFTFYKSIKAISKFFIPFLSAGFLSEDRLFDRLREIGKECEKAMFQATSNINTHKGIVFSLAVILGSIGVILRKKQPLHVDILTATIKATCKDLVKKDLFQKSKFKSAGEKYFKLTKNGGIREEAQNGYPHIFSIALPFYRTCKQNSNEDKALKSTLLHLISTLEDTTLYKRGGLKGLEFAQKEAKLLVFTHDDEKLSNLNKTFIKQNLSPGGSADILALTWFLDSIIIIPNYT